MKSVKLGVLPEMALIAIYLMGACPTIRTALQNFDFRITLMTALIFMCHTIAVVLLFIWVRSEKRICKI